MIPSRKWSILLVTAATTPQVAAFHSSCCLSRASINRHRVHGLRRLHSTVSSHEITDENVEKETLSWLRRVVVGWNLCPFADRSLRDGTLHVHTVRGTDEEAILGAILGEMLVRKDVPGTSLMIAPECYPQDFEKYLSFIMVLENDLMSEYELHGHVQVAPFHPLFQFEGSGEDGVDNHTNRSPYPMFHILREAEVEKAVEKLGGDAGLVWKRNVELMEDLQETLGTQGVKEAISGKPETKQAVEEVLKRHRFKLW
jgi:hypothetical protein